MDSLNAKPTVYLVDDDSSVLKSLSRAIEQYDLQVQAFPTAELFLERYKGEHGCLVLDLSMPEMDGLELQAELAKGDHKIPIIFITGHGGVPESVQALRCGAIDFLQKPFRTERLLESIHEAIDRDAKIRSRLQEESSLRNRIAKLTDRERVIFDLLVEAEEQLSSKAIARELDISHRTVEHHRSRILDKIGVHTVVELRLTVSKLLVSSSAS